MCFEFETWKIENTQQMTQHNTHAHVVKNQPTRKACVCDELTTQKGVHSFEYIEFIPNNNLEHLWRNPNPYFLSGIFVKNKNLPAQPTAANKNIIIYERLPVTHISFLRVHNSCGCTFSPEKVFIFYQITMSSALNLTVKVHPLVLFQVVDAYERRNADSKRVIGTLLGKLQCRRMQPCPGGS